MVAFLAPLACTLLAVVAVTAAACSRSGPPADSPATPVPAAPVQAAVVVSDVLHRLDSAWNAVDAARFAAELSNDAGLISIFGIQFFGRAEIEERTQSIFDTW